ncbi:MAG: cation:proton antiporter [Gammaproteobacteria bacterium]|nr:cation:proton antiporter [Gammaproteobacteria bacterium]MBJ53983.1 cation:proton antiporter [Gammaproteobacteria bacterium]|tara:strand:+ start:1585 stop:3063 length:1479 start_codon:yes stop_codon:yes gene_type:complete
MLAHLPVLVILAPLLGAPVASLLRGPNWPWLLATLLSWFALLCSVLLLIQVNAQGTFIYTMGGWEAPWGIEYRIDFANALLLVLITGLASVVLPYARLSVEHEIGADRCPLFYTALLLLILGLCGITVTGDAFNVFVFLEVSSLATYTLIAMGRDRRALTASFSYLIMGTIGATFYLIGVGFLYVMTGTLNMADLAERLPAISDSSTVRTAFAFIVTGICLKLALFPLHLWLPNAYTYSPSAVTAFLGATATKVAVYVLIRFVFTIFGVEFSFGAEPLAEILVPLAIIGLLSASTVSIMQPNIKRMLAYSSVAQIGYIVLGLAMGTAMGLTASLLHVFNHGLMKGALFMVMGAVAYRMGGTSIDDMRGLAKTMPLTFWAFVLGGLSLIGVPLTVGFVSKWHLILAALELGWWPVVVAILAGSMLAVVYVGRVVEAGFFGEPKDATKREAPWGLLVPLWVLVIANIWFGIDTRLTVDIAEAAAAQLMAGGVVR